MENPGRSASRAEKKIPSQFSGDLTKKKKLAGDTTVIIASVFGTFPCFSGGQAFVGH